MSRYSFDPQIDPARNRNRRVLMGAAGIGVALIVGVGLIIAGCTALGGRGSTATPTPGERPKVAVTLFVSPPANVKPAATPAPSGDNPAQPAQPQPEAPTSAPAAQPMDPRGKIEGIADFSCPDPHSAPQKFGYGAQSNWPVGDIGHWNSVLAEQLKLNWVRAKVNWYEYEQQKGKPVQFQYQLMDAFVGDANKKGLNIVLTITQPPQWARVTPPKNAGQRPSPPEDYNEGARFFGQILARYKGCVQAVEMLNEPNLDREWVIASGELKAADYVAFLKVVVPALREISPETLLIMAAPSPTGANIPGGAQDDFAYLDDFVKAGGLDLVDCIGVHLNGYNYPPDKEWDSGYDDPTAKFRGPFANGGNPHHSWSFLSTIKGYRERTNKPMCVTEFGWASIENLTRKDGSPVTGTPPGFDFALDNTEEEQAKWIIQAFQTMRELGYVRFASVFNLDFIQKIGQSPDEAGGDPALYSIIRQNGAPRPAFTAIQNLPKD